MPSLITICTTCKRQDWEARGSEVTDGETLADLVEAAASGVPGVETRRHACLMGCDHGCNVAIQGDEKLTYVLGRFEPSAEAAGAIVEYAQRHDEAASGQVPFKQWPQPIKGHFVSRIPPLPGGAPKF